MIRKCCLSDNKATALQCQVFMAAAGVVSFKFTKFYKLLWCITFHVWCYFVSWNLSCTACDIHHQIDHTLISLVRSQCIGIRNPHLVGTENDPRTSIILLIAAESYTIWGFWTYSTFFRCRLGFPSTVSCWKNVCICCGWSWGWTWVNKTSKTSTLLQAFSIFCFLAWEFSHSFTQCMSI